MKKIIFALPKGRILDEISPILKKIKIEIEQDFYDENSRKLKFKTSWPELEFIRVRSFDVASFVAYGASHIGIAGSDVLMEFESDEIYSPLDLKLGICRLSVAAKKDIAAKKNYGNLSHLRIASKYPNITKKFFAEKGIQAECVKFSGAMELAPILGLSNYIVDLVSTGKALQQNGLVEIEKIADVSSRLIVNRTAFKTKNAKISQLIKLFSA